MFDSLFSLQSCKFHNGDFLEPTLQLHVTGT